MTEGEFRKRFGERLAQLRGNKGISQEALARAVGVSLAVMNRTERGRNFPRPATLVRMAEQLDVRPEDLFNGLDHSGVAQPAVQGAVNAKVRGSSPRPGASAKSQVSKKPSVGYQLQPKVA